MVRDGHLEKGSSIRSIKTKGKVLPWSLFIETAKAPEQFTELTFSAAARRRVKGRGLPKSRSQEKPQSCGRAAVYTCPNLSPM